MLRTEMHGLFHVLTYIYNDHKIENRDVSIYLSVRVKKQHL